MRSHFIGMDVLIISLGIILCCFGVVYYRFGNLDKYPDFGGLLADSFTNLNVMAFLICVIGGLIIVIGGFIILAKEISVNKEKDMITEEPLNNRHCPECGRPIPMDAIFCSYCSHKF